MIDLLLDAKKARESTADAEIEENCLAGNSPQLASILLRYDALPADGFEQNPLPKDRPPPDRSSRLNRILPGISGKFSPFVTIA